MCLPILRHLEFKHKTGLYKGKILEEAFNIASNATISERYIATIREVTSIQSVTEEMKTDYYLVKLEPV